MDGTLLFLFIGLLSGFAIGFLVKSVLKGKGEQRGNAISLEQVEQNFVSKALHDQLAQQLKEKDERFERNQVEREKVYQDNLNRKELTFKDELSDKEKQIVNLEVRLGKLNEQNFALENQLRDKLKEVASLQDTFKAEFKNLANEIMEEKSKRFVEINEEKVGKLLHPLRDKITDFERKVDETYKDETRERASLKKELEQIVKLNNKLSDDASKLTSALKGDKKLQGDWGETQLELILEKAGLQKDIHYAKQPNYKDDGGHNQRPDYVVNLPEGKNLILDSKVSLVAYEHYFNAEDQEAQSNFLRTHLQNIAKHISDLSGKQYPKLYGINAPDYVLMFVPIEPALILALKEDVTLFEKALAKNIVLVSTSTLLATLRTIAHIWRREDQRNNVEEIARIGGALYDKFQAFTEDMINVGSRLDKAKLEYSGAMNKLFESKRKGDTILGRVEQLKQLGANTTKNIDPKLLDRLKE